MFLKRALAGTTLTAMLALAIPAMPALADGAASTRNILLGIGAATYLVIQHNRKVHEKYAEDARRQAELQSENNDAWAAYHSEKTAYDNSVAEVSDLKREVAYQHSVIMQQRKQLSMSDRGGFAQPQHVAYAPSRKRNSVRAARPASSDVAMESYGWGQI